MDTKRGFKSTKKNWMGEILRKFWVDVQILKSQKLYLVKMDVSDTKRAQNGL